MVHTDRPLQEKMTLFWHNHFATGYTKIAGALGAAEGDALHGGEAVGGSGRRARPDRDAARQRARQLPRHPGQHREGHGDARLARRPDEHEGAGRRRTSRREIMELFTMGVGHYTEADVYAGGARVHRLEPGAARRRGRRHRSTTSSSTTPAQHDTAAKTFSFPIYPDGSTHDPGAARRPTGMQDGLDFINALAAQPEHRRATWRRKLYRFFVSRVRRRRRRVRRTASPTSTCRAATT